MAKFKALAVLAFSVLAFFLFKLNIMGAFLASGIVLIFFYYVLLILTERDSGANSRKSLLVGKVYASVLLILLFFGSVLVLKVVQQPSGNKPYFNNADYHVVSNAGIGFSKKITLYNASTNSLEEGLWSTESGSLVAVANGENFKLRSQRFLEPVFVFDGNKNYLPINPVFKENVSKGFIVSNATNVLEVEQNTGKKDSVSYKVRIKCSDVELLREFGEKGVFTDEITISDKIIKKGKSLYAAFIENKAFTSDKPKSKQILEAMLQKMGRIYLLNDFNDGQFLFPSGSFFDENYKLVVGGKQVSAQFASEYSLQPKQQFFVGFYNQSQKRYFDATEEGGAALYFEHPRLYSLASQTEKPYVGNTEIRFLQNHYSQLPGQNLKEGFLFGSDYREATSNFFSGNLLYTIDKPGVAPKFEFYDINSHILTPSTVDKGFVLESQSKGLKWLFQIKDLSANGFSLGSNLLYLSLIFLGLLFTILLNANQRFSRLEPIIYAVLYMFLVFRFVLLWRVATFPPLDTPTSQEFTTLLHFDYSFLGLQFVPLTFLLPVLFLVGLNIYRAFFLGQTSVLEKLKYKSYSKVSVLSAVYGLILLVCLFVFLVAKSSPSLDILRRVFGVFIPLGAYILFTQKVLQHSPITPFKQVQKQSSWIKYIQEWWHYLSETPNFYVTVGTLAYFGIVDSGFGIVFLLFLVLKNTLFSFLRKPFQNGFTFSNLTKPSNYWVYGIFFLVVYLLFLSYKPLFYLVFEYKNAIIALLGFLVAAYAFVSKKKKLYVGIGLFVAALFIIPFTSKKINSLVDDKVKHVVHRAAILYQPVDSLISARKYNSFSERRIVETAENQWFINSYMSKKPEAGSPVTFQPHFNKGVGYTTQTRDVVVPRFIAAEWGGFTLFCLLVLLLIPILVFMLSYYFYDDKQSGRLSAKSYAAGVSLLLFFTIGFFVWLSSTNRFVFFGQDFPFLSLTSKLSLLLPLSLLFLPFFTEPVKRNLQEVSVRGSAKRYGLLAVLVAVFVLVSGRSNQLKESNFQISLESTENAINHDLNNILESLQEDHSYGFSGTNGVNKLLSNLLKSEEYQNLLQTSNPYTKSVLEILRDNKSLAFRPESPIYLRYDDGKYETAYNRHLYLSLSPYSDLDNWKGGIYQQGKDSLVNMVVKVNQQALEVSPAVYSSDMASFKMVSLPANWFYKQTKPLVILNIKNPESGKAASLQLIGTSLRQPIEQNVSGFVNVMRDGEIAHVVEGAKSYIVSLSAASGHVFVNNYWVNGKQKLVYPLGSKLFWAHHYAQAVKSTYTDANLKNRDVFISLDYGLSKDVQDRIDAICNVKYKKPGFKFGVIAADGNGNIRLMVDYANNRKRLDPNDEKSVEELHRNYFFFSNSRNERDQWGNTNLLHLALGPGSSIKPLVFGTVASQVNAGWEKMLLKPLQANEIVIEQEGIRSVAKIKEYGGFDLGKRAWQIEPGDAAGDFSAVRYITKSSNFYHSLVMFLGSYSKEDFKLGETYNLTAQLSNDLSSFPRIGLGERVYALHKEKTGLWPKSAKSEKSYFGSEKSVLATGLGNMLGLLVQDIDKTDFSIKELDRVNYGDSLIYKKYNHFQLGSFLWSFPEQSYFLQAERKHKNKLTNFSDGLKNPTLGGKPYNITPLKMAEMYGRLFSQNQNYDLRIHSTEKSYKPWPVDETWQAGEYEQFLKSNVFEGMKAVLGPEGTARGLFGGTHNYGGYYFYAKTGTINESLRNSNNSKRLVLVISKNDIQQTLAKDNKFYVLFFTANQMGKDQDWALYKELIDGVLQSETFKEYMK